MNKADTDSPAYSAWDETTAPGSEHCLVVYGGYLSTHSLLPHSCRSQEAPDSASFIRLLAN
ncbi:MAG: hypothetical protein Q8L79_07465 [Methylobacter sp.]|uniref:hypothetical protein n=1 Tax=Methylobacter sp. TaxID=2051955 RepID=UPI002730C077|nr:hypothetical protein [Methylobacter sp.]MDP1664951.1 hypothetical protein [Methylobacter sp.]